MENKKIEVKSIVKKYDNGVVALNDVSLSINEGTFNAIMGPSGSGKSTLMTIIGLLDEATSGELFIDNKQVKSLNEKEMAKMRMETVGFVFQSFYLNPHLSAVENVMLPMRINPTLKGSDLRDRAIELMKMFGIDMYADTFPGEMSGGEQQRVCIARALANNPSIILADEPTGNLDEENEKIIFSSLKELSNQGKTVVVISHNEAIKEYADFVFNIVKGKIK